MLLEIGSFIKGKNKQTNKQKKNNNKKNKQTKKQKNKTKQKPEKKNQNCIKSGLFQFLFLQQKM